MIRPFSNGFQAEARLGGGGGPSVYRGADKSLARPGRKQARKHVRSRAISTTSRRELSSIFINFFSPCKPPKEIHVILTETLSCVLPGRAKDLPEPLTLKSKG